MFVEAQISAEICQQNEKSLLKIAENTSITHNYCGKRPFLCTKYIISLSSGFVSFTLHLKSEDCSRALEDVTCTGGGQIE